MNKFLNYFIHDNIQSKPIDYTKARILVATMLLFLGFSLFYTSFFILNGTVLDVKALFNYIGIFAIGGTLLLIKNIGNILIPLRILSGVGLMLITVSISLSGGIYSHDFFWYAVLSTTGIMFISLKDGLIHFGLSIICILTFYFLEVLKIHTFPTSELTAGIHYKLANILFITVIMVGSISVLAKGNQRLQELIQKVREQTIREEISRDFHDQIGNQLASIQHLSKVTKADPNSELGMESLTRIENYSNKVYHNFKDFIWAQNPKNNTTEELFIYIKDFLEDHFKLGNTSLYIDLDNEELPQTSIPFHIANDLVPFIKEVATNIYKHANASRVDFKFSAKDGIEIEIIDNGVGFDVDNSKKGNGLANLTKRAERMDGTYSIQSTSEGTRVKININLP